jgi:UrcA family protein
VPLNRGTRHLRRTANAAALYQITISTPSVKVVGRDSASGASIEETTVQTRVEFDPVTLTTNSGVALLKDKVLEAARTACESIDPVSPDDGTCVRDAVQSAQAQIDAAVAKARNTPNS